MKDEFPGERSLEHPIIWVAVIAGGPWFNYFTECSGLVGLSSGIGHRTLLFGAAPAPAVATFGGNPKSGVRNLFGGCHNFDFDRVGHHSSGSL